MIVAQQPRDPGKQFVGISVVILLHVLLAYALLTGLARKVVDVLKKPLEVNIVEELKALPPPKNLPPPPKVLPPPAFVPPPEVHVEAPPQQNTVVVTTTVAPPEPAPVTKPAPPVVNVGVVCPNHLDVRNKVAFPAQALRLGLSGDVLVEFTISASGAITNIGVVKSTNRVFNDAAIDAIGKLRCVGQGRDLRVNVPFNFRLEN
jgi:protein TonB